MANDIEIVLAPDCTTQIEVGAQQSLLVVDRPGNTSANGETIALPPRTSFDGRIIRTGAANNMEFAASS
jgi:hypothetical protein